MLIYTCISTHGFGHAARQAAVLAEINRLRPDWKLVISTAVNQDFISLAMQGVKFTYRRVRWDIGVVQSNALDVDLHSTLSKLKKLDLNAQSRQTPQNLLFDTRLVRFARLPASPGSANEAFCK